MLLHQQIIKPLLAGIHFHFSAGMNDHSKRPRI